MVADGQMSSHTGSGRTNSGWIIMIRNRETRHVKPKACACHIKNLNWTNPVLPELRWLCTRSDLYLVSRALSNVCGNFSTADESTHSPDTWNRKLACHFDKNKNKHDTREVTVWTMSSSRNANLKPANLSKSPDIIFVIKSKCSPVSNGCITPFWSLFVSNFGDRVPFSSSRSAIFPEIGSGQGEGHWCQTNYFSSSPHLINFFTRTLNI